MIRDFKQTDPRWAAMLIGQDSMTMAEGGCGVCAIADLVDVLPPEVARWMDEKGYIYPDQGTVHEGVAPTLRHFGSDGQMMTGGYINGQMRTAYFDAIYDFVSQGFCAIFLMGGLETKAGGACRNSFWSRKGHYIAIVGAEYGRLLAYDPAWDVRNGWHSIRDYDGLYEDSYNGNVKKIWTTQVKWKNTEDFMFSMSPVRLGTQSVDAYQLQVQLRARGFKGADKKQLSLDGSAGENTMYAYQCYCVARAKQGVDLNPDVCDRKSWGDFLGKG